jgi:ABC-type polysaccharide/polyol phosphate export permease
MTRYLSAIWQCRYFWLSLVRLDVHHRYRRSVLGMGWSLLHPLAMTAILCAVFHKFFEQSVGDYAAFLLAGFATWNFVLAVATQGCQSFFRAESYIRQHPAPLAIYPLRTTLAATVHLLLALAMATALSWCFKGFGNLHCLPALVPAVFLLVVLGWSVAVLAGVLTVFFQDTQHLLEVGFQMLFYVTPIMYRPRLLQENNLGWVVRYNPLAAFLELVRQPLVEGRAPSLACFAIAGVTALVAACLAGLTLARLQRRLVFHL